MNPNSPNLSPASPASYRQSPSPSTQTHNIEVILQSVDSLPTLSPVAMRVLSIGSSLDANFDELSRLIEADPALTIKIIGLCRRAALGLGDRITTVKRALVMLGFESVRAAVLSVSVYEIISREAEDRDDRLSHDLQNEACSNITHNAGSGRAFDRVGYWMYSVGVASAAELLAADNRQLKVKPEEAFVAGLLHGLGKPILDLLLPRAYGQIVEVAERRRCDMALVEREVFGIDHLGAARRIAERWGLPDALRDVMWLYAHPLSALPEGVSVDLVRTIATSRALCRELHLGECGDFGPIDSASSLANEAGLSKHSLDHTTRYVHEAVAERCQVLGLDEQAPPELLLKSITTANKCLAKLSEELEERADEGKLVGRVLGAVAEFWRSGGGSSDPACTLGAMAKSASRLLGTGRWGAVLDRGPNQPWLLCLFESNGKPTRTVHAPLPETLADLDLARVQSWEDRSGVRSALATWAGETLGLDTRVVSLRVVRCCEGQGVPGCVLLTDAPVDMLSPGEKHLVPLRATWSAAMSATVGRAKAGQLAENLAQSNHALAAAQASLTEAQSMARLGEMTAGAAHEMNNPLTVIQGRAQILAAHLEDDRDQQAARTIVEAASDLSDLVTALHKLAEPGPIERAATPIEEILEGAAWLGTQSTNNTKSMKNAENTADSLAGRVCLDLPPEPILAFVDGEKLVRALAELVRNAREWSPDGIVQLQVQIEPENDRLNIRVLDNGPGLSEKARHHAFDPFFSERQAGRGRGLGLALARRLVEFMDGTIRLEPGEQGGVRAVVSLENWRVPEERAMGQVA